jgi:hypothetical protein
VKYLIVLIMLLVVSVSAQELTKEVSYDAKFNADGTVEVRRITQVLEGETVLSTSYHRFNGVVEPAGVLPEEIPQNIKDGVKAMWTKEVVDKFKLEKAKKINIGE